VIEMEEVLVLSKNDAVKLLAILERSLIKDETLAQEKRLRLIDMQFDMMDRLADFLGVNLDEGTINPNTFEYVKFKDE
jgi:ribosome assembly protein YihI (activator of Der GTPase)